MKTKIIATATLALLLPVMTFAAQFNSDGNIGKSEKPTNLYTAAERVNVDANVSGDLVTAGGDVFVNGDVEDNLLAAGGTVTVNGNIGKNARIGGGTVIINGNVDSDLVVFGGTVTIGSSSTIKGDVIMFGGTIDLNGRVNGKIYGSGGDIKLNGTVSDVKLDNIGTLTLGSKSIVYGNLVYSASEKATMDSGYIVKGETKFTKVAASPNSPMFDPSWILFFLLSMLGNFIAILILFLLFPKKAQTFVEFSFSKTWINMGAGFLTLITIPVLVIIGIISNVGIPLAGLLTFFFITLLLLAGLMASLLVGSLARKILNKAETFEVNWMTIAIGVVMVGLLNIIPIVGGLLVFGFFLISVGASVNQLFMVSKQEK